MSSPGLVFRLGGISPERLLLFRYLPPFVQGKCIRGRKPVKEPREGEIEYSQFLKIGEVSQRRVDGSTELIAIKMPFLKFGMLA